MKLNFAGIIHNKVCRGFGRRRQKLPTPIINITEQSPSKIKIEWQSNTNIGNVFIQYCDNELFNCGTSEITTNSSFTLDLGEVLPDMFFRVRFRGMGFRPSDFSIINSTEILPSEISVSNLQKQEFDGEIQLSWNSPNNLNDVDNISISRREVGGSFSFLDTLPNTTTTYSDTTSENGTIYEYKIKPIISNIDFIGQPSIIEAQPSGNPQLTTPSNLIITPTSINGEVNFSFNSINNATGYEIFLDDVSQGVETATTVNFTNLTINQQYKFSVKSIDNTGNFDDSEVASITYTPQDVENQDVLTIEQYGGESFYLPLDGREAFGETHPLINTKPYSTLTQSEQDAVTALGISTENYTIIHCTESVFQSSDVGLECCVLYSHLNPGVIDYARVDEYSPGKVTSRYSNVIGYLDSNNIVVDFEYNGGEIIPTQKLNASCYLFKDNSSAWSTLITELNSNVNNIYTASFNEVFEKDTRPYKLKGAYVIKNHSVNTINANSDITIKSISSEKVFLKFGIEDRYRAELSGGTSIYTNHGNLFNVGNFDHNFISINVVYGSVHRRDKTPDSFVLRLFNGFVTNPTHVVIGSDVFIEKNQIDEGISAEKDECLPTLGIGNAGRGGVFVGEDLARRAVDFADFTFINCGFAGSSCASQASTTSHGQRHWYINTRFNFSPQSNYSTTESVFESVIVDGVDDYNPFHPEYKRARTEGWMPTDVLKIQNGNLFNTLQMGGSNRHNVFNIDKFVFYLYLGKMIPSYWRIYFRKNKGDDLTNISTSNQEDTTTISSSAILGSEIPRTNKSYTVSRFYHPNNMSGGYTYAAFDGYQSLLFSLFVENIDGTFINNEEIYITDQDQTHRMMWLRNGNQMLMIDTNGNFRNNRPTMTGTVTGVSSGATANITEYKSVRLELGLPNDIAPFVIRTTASWGAIQQKHAYDMTEHDLDMIPESGKPVELQPADEFYIEPYLIVKPFNGASISLHGQSISQPSTGATAVIKEISKTFDLTQDFVSQDFSEFGANLVDYEDAYMIVLENITGAFDTSDITINSENIEIISKFEHDLNEVWTIFSKNVMPFPLNTGDAAYSEHLLPVNERLGSGFSDYNIYGFYLVCDKEIPSECALTLPIKIKTSNSEYLLNNSEYQPTTQIYLGNSRLGQSHWYQPTQPNRNWSIEREYRTDKFDGTFGSVAGHLAYSQGHLGYYFKNCSIEGFWRQNYRKPQVSQITFNGETRSVIPLAWYSNGHTLVDCTTVPSGQFSNGEEGSQDFLRRRFLEDYLISEGLLDPITSEADRAKLRSLGGVEYNANNKYDGNSHGYVRAETVNTTPGQDDSDPGLPEKVLNVLNSINFSI